MTIYNYLRLIGFLLLTVFLSYCSGEEDINKPKEIETELTIATDQSSYAPLEIVVINHNGEIEANQTLSGKLGNNSLSVSVTDESLIFIVPAETEEGNQLLKIEGIKNSLILEVTKAIEITDPDAIVNDFVDLQSISDGAYTNEMQTNLNNFNLLSEEQKSIAAQFVLVNQTLINQLEQQGKELQELQSLTNLPASLKSSLISAECDAKCVLIQVIKVAATAILVAEAGTAATIATGIIVGIDVGIAFITGKNNYILKTVIPALLKGLKAVTIDRMALAYETIMDYTTEKIGLSELKALKAASNTSSLDIENYALLIEVSAQFRTLNLSDKDSSNPIYASFISTYLKLKDVWKDYFQSDFGTLPELVDEYEMKSVVTLDGFGMEMTQGDSDLTYQILEDGKVLLEFSSNLLNDLVNFNFTFNDGYNQTSSENIEQSIYQNGFLETVDVTNSPVLKNESTTLKLKVVNSSDIELKDATVEFKINSGQGYLSTTNDVSNENGEVSTTLTVTDDQDHIELEVILKDNAENIIDTRTFSIETSEQYNYQLLIGDYNPDYTQINPLITLNRGDAITLPNNITQMVTLMLDGEMVKVQPYSLDWSQKNFGEYPTSASDIHDPNYIVRITDATNNRAVEFELNVTLTNDAYSQFVGSTISCDPGSYGTPEGNPRKITFGTDGNYSAEYNDGSSAGSGSYSFVSVIGPSYVNCGDFYITKNKVGCIHLSGGMSGGYSYPEYIYLYDDGTMGANSFYGCDNRYRTWHIY